MNALTAYAELREIGQPVLRTREVAMRFHMNENTAISLLRRLERAGLVTQVCHGLWAVESIDPLALPEHLTAPLPSYVSFETALFQHGMIEQIPPRVTVASVAKPRVVKTAFGSYLIRQIPPHLFGGFEYYNGALMATPEKALFDTVYRAAQRGWSATYFPEIEIPDDFDAAKVDGWIDKIVSSRLRTMTTAVLSELGVPMAHAVPQSVVPAKARSRVRELRRSAANHARHDLAAS